jgi:hypothetical protein
MKKKETKRKKYVKPEVRKHKSVAVVSGSDDEPCNWYHSGANEYSYYH